MENQISGSPFFADLPLHINFVGIMVDKFTPEQRHRCMSHIRAKDTKPEMIVRKWLWAEGFRYRLYVKGLPGSPDIVMRQYKTVIFINGCYWHGHDVTFSEDGKDIVADSKCCKIPKSNRDFWVQKITRNVERDYINLMRYKRAGWHVLTVWECQLRGRERQQQTLMALSQKVNSIILESYRRPNAYKFEPEEQMPLVAEEPFTYEKKQ